MTTLVGLLRTGNMGIRVDFGGPAGEPWWEAGKKWQQLKAEEQQKGDEKLQDSESILKDRFQHSKSGQE